MTLDELFPRDEDDRDLEIAVLIDMGVTDPEICWIVGCKGGHVTAMREALEAEDARRRVSTSTANGMPTKTSA